MGKEDIHYCTVLAVISLVEVLCSQVLNFICNKPEIKIIRGACIVRAKSLLRHCTAFQSSILYGRLSSVYYHRYLALSTGNYVELPVCLSL